MDKETLEEFLKQLDSLIAFWQGKLDHDDANLISPTVRLLIQKTVDSLKRLMELLKEDKNKND